MLVKSENPLSKVKDMLFAKSPEISVKIDAVPFVDPQVIMGVGSMLNMPSVAIKPAGLMVMTMAAKTPSKAPETMLYSFVKMVLSPETKGKAYAFSWDALNYMTVSAVTCASIVTVQSPTKTMLVSLAKDSKLIPSYTGGFLALARVMYRGTSSALSGSALRTAYVNGAKEVKPVEETRTTQAGYLISIAMGELAVKQIPESLSTLQKADLLPKKFNWKTPNNVYQLMSGGFTPKLMSGLINMGCLCMLSDAIAEKLPVANKDMAYALGGAGSGIIAALASYPFAAFGDYTLIQGTVSNDGKLTNVSSLSMLKKLVKEVNENPKAALKSFRKTAPSQLLIRVGLTAMIFTIVSVVGEALGKEPLKAVAPGLQPARAKNSIGFFNDAQTVNSLAIEQKDSTIELKA